jgi:hypothetical protein
MTTYAKASGNYSSALPFIFVILSKTQSSYYVEYDVRPTFQRLIVGHTIC